MSIMSITLLSAGSVATVGFLSMIRIWREKQRRQEAALQRAVALRRRR